MFRPLAVAVLVALPALAGCTVLPGASETGAEAWPLEATFDTTGPFSRTLEPGAFASLPVEAVDVFSFDGVPLHVGIWRPDVGEGEKVPVLIDAGPYYGDGDVGVDEPAARLGRFLIENFVPHGYAVVQASIRGTGRSGGCVDYMGDVEQRDMDALVTYFGEQDWSNGAVAMIGRSYDGSTPWEAATFGNPYLKTIVPVSGIHDLGDLHYHNGTAETRSLVLGGLYYSYAFTDGGTGGPEDDPQRAARAACARGPQSAPFAAAGAAAGGGAPQGVDSPYWTPRDFDDRVLANYQGSLFYVHGLQDWNVKPNQGAEVYNAFPGPKKALLGQWGHHYPDRPDEHDNLRWDWAEMLLRWFDRELKGLDVDTGPDVSVQDHTGHWRDEPFNAWPPLDAEPLVLHPSETGKLVAAGANGTARLGRNAALAAAGTAAPTMPDVLAWETEPMENGTHVSGQPTFHVTLTPDGEGGNLHAFLYEVPTSGEAVLLGRAQMNLHYHAGGKTYNAVTPGSPLVAHMQFYPLDARLSDGARLRLELTQEVPPTVEGNLPSGESAPVTVLYGDAATTFTLPLVERPYEPSRWDAPE